MLNTCRVPLTDRKVKEKRAMKQHKAMIVALMYHRRSGGAGNEKRPLVICEVHIRTGQTEVAVFTAYESE